MVKESGMSSVRLEIGMANLPAVSSQPNPFGAMPVRIMTYFVIMRLKRNPVNNRFERASCHAFFFHPFVQQLLCSVAPEIYLGNSITILVMYVLLPQHLAFHYIQLEGTSTTVIHFHGAFTSQVMSSCDFPSILTSLLYT